MKKQLFYILFLSLSISFAQKTSKNLGDFNQLKVYDGLTVTLIESSENKAVIQGEYAKNLQLVQKNDLLKIKLDIEKYHAGKGTHVDLYYKTLFLIDANEGATITANNTINSIDLDVNAQEGSTIDLSVQTQRIGVKSISGSTIQLNGITKNQDVTVNTGAEYHGKSLKSNQTNATVSTGATARVFATEIVKATAKTGGVLRIYGYPKMVDEKRILGGSITVVD